MKDTEVGDIVCRKFLDGETSPLCYIVEWDSLNNAKCFVQLNYKRGKCVNGIFNDGTEEQNLNREYKLEVIGNIHKDNPEVKENGI